MEEIRKILARVNPWLLEELDDRLDDEDDTDYENLAYDDAPAAEPAPVAEQVGTPESADSARDAER